MADEVKPPEIEFESEPEGAKLVSDGPWKSRKFVMMMLVTVAIIALPIIYKNQGITEGFTYTVLGFLIGASGLYNVANVLSKKINSAKKDE